MIRVEGVPDPNASGLLYRAGGFMRIVAIRMLLISDVVVGNRQWTVLVRDKNGLERMRLPPPQTIAASLSVVYTMALNVELNYGPAVQITSLPGSLFMAQDDVLEVVDVASVSAGDRISGLVLTNEYGWDK